MATKDELRDKIRKLLAHAESAAKIGNTGEASNYKAHAQTLMRRHRITKKSLTAVAKPEPVGELRGKVNGTWVCKCGFQISINIDAPAAFANMFVRSTLGPHMGQGHKLERR